MNLEPSWTDNCLLTVLLFSVLGLLRSARKEHMRLAFKHIFKQPVAVSAAIILLFFLIIGVLDSIHFYSPKNKTSVSVLDVVLTPLGDTYEQSYSSPFALTLYTSELLMVDGHVEQIYPRLTYSSNIKNNPVKLFWIIQKLAKALGVSLLVVMVLGAVFYAVQRPLDCFVCDSQRHRAGESIAEAIDTSRRRVVTPVTASVLITVFVLVFLSVASYLLSRQLHILGTGQIGQDIFYYAVKSIRTGLVIGILTTLFMMPVALFAGIAAGYFGGWIDDVIQYVYTTLSSIPGVLLITASVLSIQTYIANHPHYFKTLAQNADAQLLALCIILGMTSWTSLCRLLRAEALKLREIDFVLAAQALGSSSFRIIRKHLLPNVLHIVIITLVLDFSFLVLAEAVLSYVGVGVSPMTISWGNMINVARLELARDPVVWWPMFAAFTFMFTLVLASNLFADAVRDAFDPHAV
jgi:peptide/nickel transport system permease protein